MIRIEVTPEVRAITSKAGKGYQLQAAYAYTFGNDGKAHAHPERFEFFVNDKAGVVKPGVYLLAPAAIYVDRNGRLSVAPDRLVAAPVAGGQK